MYKDRSVGRKRPKSGGGRQTKYRKPAVITAAQKRAIMKAAGAELKFHDTPLTTTTVSNAGAVLSNLTTVTQGVEDEQRIGRAITVENVLVRGQVQIPAGSTSTDRVRIMVVQDRQTNKATYSTSDLLEHGKIDSFRNLSNAKRFNVLLDKFIDLNVPAGVTGSFGAVTHSFKTSRSCNIEVEYDGTTGSVSELVGNSITVFAISQSGVATILYESRIRFRG